MPIPNVYQTTPPPALANYDFVDTNMGIGFKQHFAVGNVAQGTFILSPIAMNSHDLFDSTGAAQGTFHQRDWDLDFKRTTIIEGRIIVTATIELDNVVGRFDTYISKVDKDDVVTQLAAISGAALDSGAAPKSFRVMNGTDLSKQTFKPGEKLRIRTEGFSGAGVGKKVYFDGANRHQSIFDDFDIGSGNKNRTDIIVLVPYRLAFT